jgi:hypothetical protein
MNTSRHGLRPLTLALGLLGLLSAYQTQAATIGNASAGLDNVSFRLIDLDPNDGIDPSLTWVNTDLHLLTYLSASNGWSNSYSPMDVETGHALTELSGSVNALPWANASLSADNGGGQSLLTPTQLNTQATLDSAQLAPYQNSNTYIDNSVNSAGDTVQTTTTIATQGIAGGNHATIKAAGAILDPNTYYAAAGEFQLSPNTLLLLQGTGSVSVNFDASTLQALQQSTGQDPVYSSAMSQATMEVYLTALPSIVNIFDESTNGYTAVYLDGETSTQRFITYAAVGVDFANPGSPAAQARSQGFSLMFSNLSATDARTGYIGINSDSQVLLDLSTQVTTQTTEIIAPAPPTPAIPEPATYALMGLGLVGVACATRRQQRTTRA